MSFEHCGSKLHETFFFFRKKSSENFREHFFELSFIKFSVKSNQNLKILFTTFSMNKGLDSIKTGLENLMTPSLYKICDNFYCYCKSYLVK